MVVDHDDMAVLTFEEIRNSPPFLILFLSRFGFFFLQFFHFSGVGKESTYLKRNLNEHSMLKILGVSFHSSLRASSKDHFYLFPKLLGVEITDQRCFCVAV